MDPDQDAALAENMMRQVLQSLGVAVPNQIAFFVGEGGALPTRGSPSAAGYDLYAASDFIVPAENSIVHDTKIKWGGAPNCVLRICDRSGNAVKKHIGVVAGVVDEDYRGTIGVCLRNFGGVDQAFAKGDRIAQALLTPVLHPRIVQVNSEDELTTTVRGEGGYGSTGGMTLPAPALPVRETASDDADSAPPTTRKVLIAKSIPSSLSQEEKDHPDLGVGFSMPVAH